MNIDVETKTIGELALEVPSAIAVMEKWRIDYCCHGNRSVAQACESAGISAAELLAALGGPRNETPEDGWAGRPLADLVHHIFETHHVYTREALETIALLSEKVANRHGANHPEVLEARRLFRALEGELRPHMMKEEQILFPYILELEAAAEGSGRPASCFGTVAGPIRVMMAEHESAGAILAALRGTTKDYALPGDACLSFRALYERLADLEQDLHRHIHLENNLLFPRALALEEAC